MEISKVATIQGLCISMDRYFVHFQVIAFLIVVIHFFLFRDPAGESIFMTPATEIDKHCFFSEFRQILK